MNKKIAFSLSLLLVTSFLWGPSAFAQDSSKKWTFMVYMDADNNLDQAGVDDISEMQTVGSSPDVDVVVLFDRWSEEFGRNGSAILHINPGWNETVWGGWTNDYELNMGNPETLTWFINYTVENFPADKYALVIWDHGGNWEGVCWDWTNDDYLAMREVREALSNSVIDKVDLLGFDACLMASIEVAYTMGLSGKAGVMVASEDSIPWDGWPYDMILGALVKTPSWNEYEFSTDIVDKYITSYSKIGWCKVFATLSAVDLTKIDEVVSCMASLAEELSTNFDKYKDVITGAKNGADRFWFGAWHQGSYIDLYQFVQRLGMMERDLKPYTDPILGGWNNFVIYSKCCNGPHILGGEGLTVYFPRNRNLFYTPQPYYESVPEFADVTGWNSLLTAYFEK